MSHSTDPSTFDKRTLIALLEASRAVNAEVDLPLVLREITHQAADVLTAEAASLLLLDASRGELVFEAATGPAEQSLKGRRMPAGEGIAGQTLQSGHVVCVDDVRQNRNFYRDIDQSTSMITRGILAAPIHFHGKSLGVIEVINPKERERFSDHDARLLEIFANLVGAAMHSAQVMDRVTRENRALKDARGAVEVVGEAPAFREALDLCARVATANTSVLLTGETGTGKEVAARLVHGQSTRRDRPFIAVNCAALPETLLESELFGHEKGSFTGAEKERQGWFELADGGTLFLDEIGEISPSTQAKLLRVLQEREFVRVGGTRVIPCDIRVIAATHRNLKNECAEGNFREDLFYRLSVFPIHIPPLRERASDIPLLVEHLVGEIAPQIGVGVPTVEMEAMRAMAGYRWPGNIRELRNVLERGALLSDGRITVEQLPAEIRSSESSPGGAATSPSDLPPGSASLVEQERALIVQAMRDCDWNQSAAARQLGITRDTLRYRLKKHEIQSSPAAGRDTG